MKIHLLQVCNVGQIVGGTGACSWSVVRSLPGMKHSVVCLGKISDEMSHVFQGVDLYEWSHVNQNQLDQLQPDLILFHNTHQRKIEGELTPVTIQYVHSRITPAKTDRTIYCSKWLADQYHAQEDQICFQSVFKPNNSEGDFEAGTDSEIRVGRICTPLIKKWPRMLVKWYEKLALCYPKIQWEFIGCPEGMQSKLMEACQGQASFYPAKWTSRRYLWHWDILLYHNPDVTESFGRTVSDAMRAGCIPVVDNRGGFREQVTEETGYLCDSQSEFEKALKDLMDNDLRKKMSHRCKEYADERFSLRRFGDDLLSQFQAACEVSV